ncbi:MAG TPA: chemotaxis protein CheA [Chryseosolibacter sp.]
MIADFRQDFIDEGKQVLKDLQHSLLQMASKDAGPDEVNHAYRFLHTLKGGAGMFGFQEVERLAHEVETFFSEVRDGNRQLDDATIDLALHAADILNDLLDDKDMSREVNAIIENLQALNPSSGGGSVVKQTKVTANGHIVILKPEREIFKRGINLSAILEELQDLGETEYIIHNETIPFEKQLASKEIISWLEIFLSGSIAHDAITDVLLFLKASEFEVLPFGTEVFTSDRYTRHIALTAQDVEHRITIMNNFSAKLVSVPEVVNGSDSRDEEEETAEITQTSRKSKKNTSVSVSTQKLDQLINIVSELVIFRSELQHLMGDKQTPAVTEAMEKLERFTLRLRDSAFNIRLVPLTILNVKLQRLIRSVSQELGKEINFITEGLDTELDRSMINALEAPLMHIIRNAIDHGIENPEERKKRNKPVKGLLKLYSYNSGDHVFIQVQDDGNGIDFQKVRAKGIQKGMLKADQNYSEKELINLMMEPGFSTADQVTTVSGRGVGMDVVKKEIAALRGDIEVSTETGLGSIFTIRMPLTLTILDTLVVTVADHKYLVPINEVEYCYEELHENLFSKKSRQVVYEGHLTPFVSLREYFSVPSFPRKETVIVIKKNDVRVAIVVDAIVGKLQTVYKPLNELMQAADCFSGASILGDGSMAFILNALKLKDN